MNAPPSFPTAWNNEYVAECLQNTVAGYDHWHYRWWVDERILVGGSINDAADWSHIRNDFKISAVLSLEIERDDGGKGLDVPYLRLGWPDDGQAKPVEYWASGIAFACNILLDPERRIYVHCALGNSRSPSMAYAILRARGLDPAEALQRFQRSRPEWGTHPVQQTYMNSAESALALFRELFR